MNTTTKTRTQSIRDTRLNPRKARVIFQYGYAIIMEDFAETFRKLAI